MMIIYKNNSDTIGMLASGLCLVHCIFTPFLFIIQTQIVAHEVSAPFWWKTLDYVFLVISFFAIYWSTKTTSKQWIKTALWSTFACLSFIIINEKIELFSIPESTIYIPAIGLILLHLYNKKFCKCQKEQCCAVSNKKHSHK